MENKKLNTESLKDILQRNLDNQYPIFTGITEFDNFTNGLYLGDVVVVAGRPNTGKTEFALQLLSKVAQNSFYNLAYYTLELSKHQLIERYMLQYSPIHGECNKQIYICDDNKLSTNDIITDVQKINNHEKLSYVIIDYVQLLQDCKDKNIWRILKELAEKENVIIIILSQLKRDSESQNVLSDLHMVNVESKYVTHTYLLNDSIKLLFYKNKL